MDKHKETFPGFPPEPVTNYWPYPKALNGYWHALSPTEQKVLDYILRHAWGYKKDKDAIALSQFINGITKTDGTVIDKGTGIRNEKTVRKALKGLVAKGFIERQDRSNIGREPIYKLRISASNQETVPLPNFGTPPIPNNGSPSSQKVIPTIKDLSIKNNNNTSPSPTGDIRRKAVSFKEEDYKAVIDEYQTLKGITLQGKEFLPIKQTIKTMFISGRTPIQIIEVMRYISKQDYIDWTIRTVQMKLPEILPKLGLSQNTTPQSPQDQALVERALKERR